MELKNIIVAILVTDGFEQTELVEPKKALEEAGATTRIVSPAKGPVQGWNHFDRADKFPVDTPLENASAGDFDALLLPGGVSNPDQLRGNPKAVAFVREFGAQGKPIAAICHGLWTLIDAGLVRGRKVTSWPTLKIDLKNAGADWTDQEVVVDRGLVTSRKPSDIPRFNEKMIETFAATRRAASPGAGRPLRGTIKGRNMETMKAVQVDRFGGPETLAIQDVPKPRPEAGEVLVRVKATGVNPVDWKLRQGFFKDLPLPFTPGGDFSGVVEELGSGVSGFKKGDEVYGCTPGSVGAEAEYLKAPTTNLALKPRTLGMVEAAGVPLAAMTAWQGLFIHGLLRAGETLLILGASGGVGSVAVQLAKKAGARTIGTASTANVARVRALGCDVVVDYTTQRFEDFAKDVDFCLDLLGGEFQKRAFGAIKVGGRLISAVQAPDAAKARERKLKAQFFRMKPDGRELMELAHKIDAGELKVEVTKVLPLERAAEAEELNRRHKVDGKIVLQVGH